MKRHTKERDWEGCQILCRLWCFSQTLENLGFGPEKGHGENGLWQEVLEQRPGIRPEGGEIQGPRF